MLNPSIYPYKTLKKLIGDAPNFYVGSSFEWSEHHIDMLENYIQTSVDQSRYMLLVQKGDELLNFREAVDRFREAYVHSR